MPKDDGFKIVAMFLGKLPNAALGVGRVGRVDVGRHTQLTIAVGEGIASDEQPPSPVQERDMAGSVTGSMHDDKPLWQALPIHH